MLRSKYILLIILWFVGAQFVASQTVVLDSVKSDSVALQYVDSLATDTIELADAEFEAWLEEYATVTVDSVDTILDVAVVDSAKVERKSDFTSLIGEGEDARSREKSELISRVMASLKKKNYLAQTNLKSKTLHEKK